MTYCCLCSKRCVEFGSEWGRQVLISIGQATRDDMDAREIESLSMISRGFEELRDVNPELAYNIILDILSGINECVLLFRFR